MTKIKLTRSPSGHTLKDETRALYGDGVFGGPYAADDALMDKVFDAAVGDIIKRLRFE